MRYTNADMDNMLQTLKKYLRRRDVFGYAAARNVRILEAELTEYTNVKNGLIAKYGERVTDDDGNETGDISLSFSSDGFAPFCEEIGPYAEIEHEPDLMTLDYAQTVGVLTGSEILELEFMLRDGEAE